MTERYGRYGELAAERDALRAEVDALRDALAKAEDRAALALMSENYWSADEAIAAVRAAIREEKP